MIGNIITSNVTKRPTTLQIALGVLLREKSLIECFHDLGVTCSYDEVLRFKTSAAAAAVDGNTTSRPITDGDNGLVQAVADNFDANISQNGIRSTHALALLLTQPQQTEHDHAEDKEIIRRLKKEELHKPVTSEVPIKHYNGTKKPPMPPCEAKHSVLTLKVLAQQTILHRRSQDLDFDFLKNIVTDSLPPEYSGFNTKLTREQGQSHKPATKEMYTPLIDMVPSDPDTMMSAMTEAKRLTLQCGQNIHRLYSRPTAISCNDKRHVGAS